uniref:Protein kinase domain-containing protein n=1 Tax=Phytophthora ramorum TaxID=164328 RepID=H3GIU1_PHYRM
MTGCLRAKWTQLASLLALWGILHSHAQSSSSSSTSASVATTAETLAREWFTDNFDDNETQLAVGVNSALNNLSSSDIMCYGVPSVQRRTNEATPNGGCPAIYTAVNASCSCLSTGYADSDTWEFYVKLRTDEGSESYPTTLTSADVLAIDSIRTMLVPTNLTTLRITGEGTYPQTITFVPQDQDLPGSTLPIAVVEDGSIAVTTVSLENIDLSSITQTASTFFPSTTLNMDMSSNHLTAAYVGSSIAHSCSNQFCAVEVLYIAMNDITDFNISSAVFSGIQDLIAFDSDRPDESATCTDGTWQTAHNRTFCVTNDTTTAVATSSGGSNYLLIGLVAGGCAIVIIVVALVLWRYHFSHKKTQRMSSSKNDFYSQEFGDTLDFDDTQVQVDPVFLNDPVIVTNRIDHKQLKMGRCISTGGFGLVFMGEYRGRRVAIKKIRPDRSATAAEIELFLKEIIMMAVLYHPRVVEFVGVAWDNLRHLSAVTEFMDNGDLRDVLHGYKMKGERLSWESHKATIALHIAEALSYLHGLKPMIIHRDLKSKNVLLNMYLEAKLSDFGISRMRYLVETHMTAGVGTSFWIAPEVLLGRDYDEAADIYSFGVVLSEIDTDDYPYWNDENKSNRGKIQEAEILSLVAAGELRPDFSGDCPKAILDLADCCLQKNPRDRPTASQIVVILEHMIHASERSSSSLHSDAWSVTSSDDGK